MTNRSHALAGVVWFTGLLLLASNLALAGPNEGGTLILHANPSLVFTNDMQNPCGQSALDSCAAAVTSVAWDPGKRIVFHAIAAFPPESSPRLKALSFGIDFDSTKFVLAARGTCADFEIPGNGWPGSGTGTSQSWTTGTQTGLLTEAYWFVGYTYSEQEEDSTSVALIPHPEQHGVFVDDAFPSEVDTIAAYGTLGFGMAGALPCPNGPSDVVWVPNGGQADIEGGEGGADPGNPAVDQPPSGEEYGDESEADLTTPDLAVWISPGNMSFDSDRAVPQSIGQITFQNANLRSAFAATGAIEILKQFPGFGPADTLRRDWRGEWIRVPDLSGFFHVRYASAEAAQAAIAGLLGTPGIGNAEPVRLGRVQNNFPNDPYDSTFCKPAGHCSNSDAQWHLINHGLVGGGPYCDPAQTGFDIGLPDQWWIPGTPFSADPILVGMVDTGLPESHPDLDIAYIPDYLRPSLQTHPHETWCQTHGQRMAGLLAAKTNNSEGVAGVCTKCELLDLESAGCPDSSCHRRNADACLSIGANWNSHLNNAKTSSEFDRMRIANIEMAGSGYALTADVVGLSALYLQGVLLTAPMANRSREEVEPIWPANIPFVLGVGGFTDTGQFWDRNTGCWPDSVSKGTSVGPGLDICAPADPRMATTDSTGASMNGSPGPYNWVSGQCSGACAITAGALGYLMNSFYTYSGEVYQEPTPDDYVGILEATARPWSPEPTSYSRCANCPLEDFGRGRLDVGAAEYYLRSLWCSGGERSFLWGLAVGWHDPRVSIDSTTVPDYFVYGDTLIREYAVRATIRIPSSGAFGGQPFVAWARPFFWCGGANENTPPLTTSCMAYGRLDKPEGLNERWQLAKWMHLTDCQMTAIDQTTGQTVLTGHNFARVVKDGQGHDVVVDYLVPPSQFRMAYSVVSTSDVISGVPEVASKAGIPRILSLPSPTDGSLRLQYSISTRSRVFVEVFDVAGRMAADLDQGVVEPGNHVVTWDRVIGQVGRASAGLYWVRVRGDGIAAVRKVVLLK